MILKQKLIQSELRLLPDDFVGEIWDASPNRMRLFVRCDKDGTKRFFCRIFTKRGKVQDFFIEYVDLMSPKQAREIGLHYYGKYAKYARVKLKTPNGKCLWCYRDRVTRGNTCFDCEIRFRAKRLERLYYRRLNKVVLELKNNIKEKKEYGY